MDHVRISKEEIKKRLIRAKEVEAKENAEVAEIEKSIQPWLQNNKKRFMKIKLYSCSLWFYYLSDFMEEFISKPIPFPG